MSTQQLHYPHVTIAVDRDGQSFDSGSIDRIRNVEIDGVKIPVTALSVEWPVRGRAKINLSFHGSIDVVEVDE